jgi:predicted nucleic acid-binding protein
MIVVSNTTPILSLYKIGRLNLLQDLFRQVTVPVAVYNEIAVIGKGKQGHDELDKADYIHVREIQNVFAANLVRSGLDHGEAEAIVLAGELKAELLLLDEKKARRVAQANAQPVIGTLGILQIAKNKGLIPDIKTSLDGLIANGIWIGRDLYRSILHNNKE